ncbi:HAD family hydrolase [bacterium]|nr:HAD family hydrolase [bacterium]
MKTKIVIFDLDGTLLNTLEDLTLSTNFALEQFGYSPKTVEEVKSFVGNGVGKLIERAIPKGNKNPNYETCLYLFKNHYAQNMYNKTKPYDGIIELLAYLKLKNIKTAVVSNKFDLAVKNLCKKYFSKLIDYAAGENEKEGIRKKPAPDMVEKVLKNFKLTTEDALYVGDSEVDIQTANNSFIQCVSVTWGFKDKDFLQKNGAEIIINTPDDLINYL